MQGVTLFTHQEEALEKMKNGCILNGVPGSGKSITAIAYYYKECGGWWNEHKIGKMKNPVKLYIITTAKKRDTCEWESDLMKFGLIAKKEGIVIDSWNNIKKYINVRDCFFLFDEQRVCGYGTWSKSFIKIAWKNRWVLLTGTPGDTWLDYIPVFIANKFYRNKSDFYMQHVILSPYTKFPSVQRYINTSVLVKHQRDVLINMNYHRYTVAHREEVIVDYDRTLYFGIVKTRKNPFTGKPIKNVSEYCACLRKVTNTHNSRLEAVLMLLEEHPKVIIFYMFTYELEMLRKALEGIKEQGYKVAEWNGEKHELLPEGDKWVYLVEYTAGCEGWNCVTTDTIIFYSQSYSYKQTIQAEGRIDRLNTPYTDLYYFYLRSKSLIDIGIKRALSKKKKFNDRNFAPNFEPLEGELV